MDFLKRHKIKLILLVVFIVIFIVSIFTIISLVYPDSKKDVYGNRLEGIEKVKISNQTITEIKDKINSAGIVNDVEYILKGRLINFNIEVIDAAKVTDAKNLVKHINDLFDQKIKNYYDIQIFIVNENSENGSYPIVAYKHKTSDKFVWTNN